MSPQNARYTCLTYCSLPYTGRWWPQTCVSLLDGFASTPLKPILAVPRTRSPVPSTIATARGLMPPLSLMPWRYVAGMGAAGLDRRFVQLLNQADPATTIAYFWPGAPPDLVRRARDRGMVTVREMINTTLGNAKLILDRAYRKLGLPPAHRITQASVDDEIRELQLYDYVCASNAPCEASLAEANVGAERIIRTSFGWSPARFETPGRFAPAARDDAGIKLLFVGSIGVRKGVPELLEAWAESGLTGELTLVGTVEPCIEGLLAKAARTSRIKVVGYTENIGAYYRSNDIFVFPTLEEGGPQVTIEAAGCGMPVITTDMGTARLIAHNLNGLVVPAGDAASLAGAMRKLAGDAELRQRFSRAAIQDAQNFTYDRLGAARATEFISRLAAQQARVEVSASA
ncbi:MAG TPA: glycosyltransferase family 4 protein [Devosiaceae bacterium]|nr:glycosyltransferase family 4 protein [Devosiaceae bacterium]